MEEFNASETVGKPPIGLAVASLVLGILAIFLSLFLLGGAAWAHRADSGNHPSA